MNLLTTAKFITPALIITSKNEGTRKLSRYPGRPLLRKVCYLGMSAMQQMEVFSENARRAHCLFLSMLAASHQGRHLKG